MNFKKTIIPYTLYLLCVLQQIGYAENLINCDAPSYFQFWDNLKEHSRDNKLIIHMMYFPWDENQEFRENEFAFDHSPYQKMVERVKPMPNAHVIMWTRSKTKEFCIKYYPAVWDMLEKYSQRNTMYIDVLRFLVVYHFGGLYWQYDSIPKSESMMDYFPSNGKKIRFLTETIITPDFSKCMTFERIRNGKPEELLRIANQVFCCNESKHHLLFNFILFQTQRMATEKVLNDYDILYIAANAALSEFYDRYIKNNQDVELVPLEQTHHIVNFNGKGSWRMDWKKK
jgi:hypothetical protein